MKRWLAFVVAKLVELRALVGRALHDRDVLREVAPLAVTVTVAPWLYLALGNYRDGAIFRDVAMFNYAAFCIRKGERMYDTIATPDGPLIYWIEAILQTIAGTSDKLQRRVDIDLQALTGAALALLIVPRAPVWKWLRRFVWAILGATLWLGWVLQGDFPQTLQRETYYVSLGLLGVALVYASAGRSPRLASAMQVLGGFLSGLQMFGKHSGVIYGAVALLTALLSTRKRKPLARNVTWTCAGVLLAIAFTFAYLLLFGSVRGFVFWYYHYDFEAYRFFHTTHVADLMSGWFVERHAYDAAVLAIGCVGIGMRLLPARSLGFALMPMLNGIAAIMQLRGWNYQLVPALASLYLFFLYALGLAWAPSGLVGRLHKFAAIGVGAVVLPLCIRQIMSSPWLLPKEKYLTEPEILNPRAAGDFIAQHTQSTDRVLYYGGNPTAPFVAQRLPATPYIVRWMLDLDGQYTEPTAGDVTHRPTEAQVAHLKEMMSKLQVDACDRIVRSPPAVMVFENTSGYNADPLVELASYCHPLDDMMKSQYFAAATFGETRIFLRNDRR